MKSRLGWLAALLLAHCSSRVELGNTGEAGGRRSGAGGAIASGGSSPGGTGLVFPSEVPPCPGIPYTAGGQDGSGGACTAIVKEVEPPKLDVYVMMDRSQSMTYATPEGTSRWNALTAAVQSFVDEARDIRMGIQFFGQYVAGDDAANCNPQLYAQPAVEIGPLTEVGASITAAMDSMGLNLGGQTPTLPALQGAIEHAAEWARAHPERRAAVLLVTDGIPTLCDEEPASLAVAAQQGLIGDPPIHTFVLGISMGANASNLDLIARAGGTPNAFLTQDTNYTGSLLSALQNMVDVPLPCQYQLPAAPNPEEVIDSTRVQMLYAGTEIPYVDSRGDCSAQYGGWYYDDSAQPQQMIVCPCTCSYFGSGAVEIYVGCAPTVM